MFEVWVRDDVYPHDLTTEPPVVFLVAMYVFPRRLSACRLPCAFHAVFPCRLPTSPSRVAFPCRLPMSSSCAAFRMRLPMPSSHAVFPRRLPRSPAPRRLPGGRARVADSRVQLCTIGSQFDLSTLHVRCTPMRRTYRVGGRTKSRKVPARKIPPPPSLRSCQAGCLLPLRCSPLTAYRLSCRLGAFCLFVWIFTLLAAVLIGTCPGPSSCNRMGVNAVPPAYPHVRRTPVRALSTCR